ncbi:MAG TPA: formyltetrahydrofolate deformylase [Terriglobales bacterium]|nr:formyltetrahydrofolate deformylase [Terriglobales bacterium]
MGPTAVLLISCLDQKGLVAEVSSFIYQNGGNIVHAEQHIDVPQGIFFHRIEWELRGFGLAEGELERCFGDIAERFRMSWQLSYSEKKYRVAIFVSKYDHCLVDLLYRHKIGELPVHLAAVLSNHPDLEPLVRGHNVPFFVFPIAPLTKESQEAHELELLRELNTDVIVLARYMQVLTSRFVQAFPNRIINIHHSFLPAFIGKQPYTQAYERGVKLIGATSHYVTEELDQGPIIEQDVCRVSHRDSVEDMIAKGRDLERQVLGRAVRLHALNRVLPYGRKTVVFT